MSKAVSGLLGRSDLPDKFGSNTPGEHSSGWPDDPRGHFHGKLAASPVAKGGKCERGRMEMISVIVVVEVVQLG